MFLLLNRGTQEAGVRLIQFEILRNAHELDGVRADWEVLARRPLATVFQRYSWNRLAAEVFGEREEPHIVVARREPALVILPLALRRDGSASLLGESLFDYRDMLSSGDRELELAALGEAASIERSLEITAITHKAAARWQPLAVEEFCRAPRIIRAFCSSHDLQRAHRRLGRHARRIAGERMILRRRDGLDRAFVSDFYLRKSTQPGSLFADPLRREFMEQICFQEGERCEIFSYERGSELVAALLTFRSHHARHFYTVYYDTAWAELSPGQVLLYEASLETLAEGLDCDFMTGEYPYKARLANSAVPLMKLKVSAEAWKSALADRSASSAA